jgi:hypothetical protein
MKKERKKKCELENKKVVMYGYRQKALFATQKAK